MTKLTPGKPLMRETAARDRSDPIVIELYPHHMVLRLKGKRAGVPLFYDQALDLARRLDFSRNRAK